MPNSKSGNRSYLILQWIPAVAACGIVGTMMVVLLTSGDRDKAIPAAGAIGFAVLVVVAIFVYQKRQFSRMLQAAEPNPFLKSMAATMSRAPHGSFFAAANTATILALYGRIDEAERALQGLPWHGAPPLVRAQESAARAAIAYVRGSVTEGLNCAVAAAEQASVDPGFPGARKSELAIRTYLNVGLALSGRAADTTVQELFTALDRLPLLGQVLAAWGLALTARRNGDLDEFQDMQAFIKKRAPHFIPVLKSLAVN